jgi:hypothetical protein
MGGGLAYLTIERALLTAGLRLAWRRPAPAPGIAAAAATPDESRGARAHG